MNILLLDDNSHRIKFFQTALKQHKLTICRHAKTAIQALKETPFEIIFLDHDLQEDLTDPADENTGSEVVRFIADQDIHCPCVILHTENRAGRESMKTLLPQSQSIPYSKLKKAGIESVVKKILKAAR